MKHVKKYRTDVYYYLSLLLIKIKTELYFTFILLCFKLDSKRDEEFTYWFYTMVHTLSGIGIEEIESIGIFRKRTFR